MRTSASPVLPTASGGSVQEKHLQVCESEESISMRRMSRLATAQFAFFARLCSTGGTADCECLLWAASLHWQHCATLNARKLVNSAHSGWNRSRYAHSTW